eukprot:235202_1
MDLPRILPWLNWEEWNKGRELLYSPNFSDKVVGVSITRVWRSRGKVPHAVDATAQLVEAVLCDQTYFFDTTENSTSSAGRTTFRLVFVVVCVRDKTTQLAEEVLCGENTHNAVGVVLFVCMY